MRELSPRRRAVAAPVRYSRRGMQGAARYRNAPTGTPRALCAEAEKAQAVVAFLRARSAESWTMPAHHPPANNYPGGNARIRRAMSWSIARIIAAATRSQSAPINGRMTFGFPTSSRSSSAMRPERRRRPPRLGFGRSLRMKTAAPWSPVVICFARDSCRVILITVMAAAADRFMIATNYPFTELSFQTQQMEKSHDQVQNRRPRIVGRRIG
jgi:hypothetical protein